GRAVSMRPSGAVVPGRAPSPFGPMILILWCLARSASPAACRRLECSPGRAGCGRGDRSMRDDTDMDRRGAVRTMLGVGALPLVGACARAAGARPALTRRQRAGQRVIFSYPGLTVPAALLKQISAGQAAGVIFFGENIASEAQIASVIRQLRQAQRRSPVASPLLLMTDQEGGLVRRLPGAPAASQKR